MLLQMCILAQNTEVSLEAHVGLFANPSQIVGYWHNTDYQRNTDIIFSPVA